MDNILTIKNATLHVSGTLKLKYATALLQQLAKITATTKFTQVDFLDTVACDTTGILLMLRLQRSMSTTLHFINVPPRLRALLNLSGLLSRFNI